MTKVIYPTTYEINTRVWLKNFGDHATLSNIPDEYWQALKDRGVDYVWLMGIWQTTESSVSKHCFHPDLISEYDRVSPHWQESDIVGSPYAIEDYVVNGKLGSEKDLIRVKNQLNRLGIKLILDFVPNHFNVDSSLVDEYPEVFLTVSESEFLQDNYTYFKRGKRFYAHGRDPYFPAWTDTVQVDYFASAAHDFMKKKLVKVSQLCDGVRCDMAMLALPDVFEKTWGNMTAERCPDNFWTKAISKVKSKNPAFIFIAEAYWDTEWTLHQLGFDFTYDKKLLDYLVHDNINDLKGHLTGSNEYHNQTVRFIENHDENRSLSALGECKVKVAAILYNTLPGMRLHYDGQWTGERIRYPVQIGTYFTPDTCICAIKTEQAETAQPCTCIKVFYDRLLDVTSQEIFKKGSWCLINSSPNPNQSVVMAWTYQEQEILIIVNLGNSTDKLYISTPFNWKDQIIHDRLNQEMDPNYIVKIDDQLQITLPPYKGCILSA